MICITLVLRRKEGAERDQADLFLGEYVIGVRAERSHPYEEDELDHENEEEEERPRQRHSMAICRQEKKTKKNDEKKRRRRRKEKERKGGERDECLRMSLGRVYWVV